MNHGPTKQNIWSATVILVASDAPAGSQGTLPVLFLWARALCKPILLHLWSEGAAFHAGRLWLLQWILHTEAVAEENSNGWSYWHQKHQEDCCALVLMLYLTRSTTLTPILLSQRRNKSELVAALVAEKISSYKYNCS